MIRKSLCLLAGLFLAPLAQAQFSLYGTLTVDHMGGIQSSPVLQTLSPLPCPGSAPVTPCTNYRSSVDPIGFTGGVSYDFRTVRSVLVSADARGVIESVHQGGQADAQGAGTRIYSGLGGLRATFSTRFPILRPYAQVSAGYARSNYGLLTNALHNGQTYPPNPLYPGIPTQNNLEYHVFTGLDLKILPQLDFRVIELGYGALQSFGTFAHSYPLLSIGTGVVLHFGH